MMTQYWWKDLFDRNNKWSLWADGATGLREDIILGINVERPFRSLVGV